jgi:hypothetical protein
MGIGEGKKMKRYVPQWIANEFVEQPDGEWIRYEDFAQAWKDWVYKRQEQTNIIRDLTIQVYKLDEEIYLLKEKLGGG